MVDPSDPWYGFYEFGWSLEVPLLGVSLFFVLVGLWRFFPLGMHRLFRRTHNPGLGLVRLAIGFAGLWFWFILATGAASDIVGFYTMLYVLLAYACLLFASFRWPILDFYHPGDVLERQNLAAGLVFAGFVGGTAFAFGGALTGEGPGWWVVIVFFVLAYAELRGNLALVSRLAGGLADDARLERDLSAGLLLAGVALASGLVSGRAAAGDFLGWGDGLLDYGRRLWPLVAIAVVAAAAGGITRHSEARLKSRAIVAGALVLFGSYFYFLT